MFHCCNSLFTLMPMESTIDLIYIGAGSANVLLGIQWFGVSSMY